MNRRELLKLSAGAAVAWCGLNTGRAGEDGPRRREGGDLTGDDLQGLRRQYRYDLFDDFLPFMDKFVIDHELGGFMCNTDRDGTNLNTKKNSWYVGRGIWVYSFLYNELERKPEYLEVARKATEFILRDPPQGDDLWPAEYDKQGNAVEAQGQYIGGRHVPVGKQVYGDLFIANGLAEYARACGEERYWDTARQLVLKCVTLYDRPDYDPTAPIVYLAGDDGSRMPGVRLLGVWMLLVRVGSQMLAHREDAEIDAVVRRSIGAIFEHHYNPEYDLLNEVLNHDMSRPDNEYRDLVYTGHGIEALWMLLHEAQRRGDQALFDKSARLLKRTMEVAWDDVYGGFFRGCKDINKNNWILDKALWVQEEALIGTLFVLEQRRADWAGEWFSKIFTYVQKTFPLKKHGYALWDFWPDRKGTFVEHYERVENFHHPRHLMLNLLSIERMIARGK
jgi:mannose/cellobiose epimerase-like protein (N-acyl-D-glucosamine 2-epimerase family)